MKVSYSHDNALYGVRNTRFPHEEMEGSTSMIELPNSDEEIFEKPLRNKLARLMAQLKECRYVIQQQETELQTLRAVKHHSPDDVAGSDECISFPVAVLKRKLDASVFLASSLRDWLKKSRAENIELSNKLANQIQRSEIAQRSESLARCEAESLSQKLKATSIYWKSKLSERDKDVETSLIAIRRETESEIAQMRNKFLDAEGRAASAMAKVKHMEALVGELSHKLTAKEKEVGDHLTSENTLVEELRATVAREKAQREEAVTKAETVEMRLQDVKSTSSQRIRQLEDQLTQSQERIEQLTGDLLKSKTDQDHLSWQLTIAENQTLRLRTELQTITKRYEEELTEVIGEKKAREAQLLSSLETMRMNSQRKISEAELLLKKHREINELIRCQLLTEVEHSDRNLSSVSRQQDSLRDAVLAAKLESKRATDLANELQQETGEQLLQVEHFQKLVVSLEAQLQQRNETVVRLEEELIKEQENTKCLADEVVFLRGCFRRQGLTFENGLAARNAVQSTCVDILIKQLASRG